ncbi:MAG TPA: VOC family protein [Acidimicrobiales bacterium]|nr:VOC family protein [Acidimicrobiales bacterium]
MKGRCDVSDLFHIGLTVSDLDRSITFYRDVAGMTAHGDAVDVDSDGFGRLTDNPGAKLRTALLAAGPVLIQLVEYTEGGGDRLSLDHRHVGSPHLSFWVDDVATLRDELARRGDVVITSDIEAVVPSIRSFYVSDPDGVPVEFIERATPMTRP